MIQTIGVPSQIGTMCNASYALWFKLQVLFLQSNDQLKYMHYRLHQNNSDYVGYDNIHVMVNISTYLTSRRPKSVCLHVKLHILTSSQKIHTLRQMTIQKVSNRK